MTDLTDELQAQHDNLKVIYAATIQDRDELLALLQFAQDYMTHSPSCRLDAGSCMCTCGHDEYFTDIDAAIARHKEPPKRGPIRLACKCCERDDYDGVYEYPDGWEDCGEEVSLSPDDDTSVWWTHTGLCPECQAAQAVEADAPKPDPKFNGDVWLADNRK